MYHTIKEKEMKYYRITFRNSEQRLSAISAINKAFVQNIIHGFDGYSIIVDDAINSVDIIDMFNFNSKFEIQPGSTAAKEYGLYRIAV